MTRFRRFALLALAGLLLASCAAPRTVRPGIEPPAAGMARIYFFRSGALIGSPSWTAVSLDGRYVGQSAPGTVFHRDVPPGTYEIEVRSAKLYPNQFKTVALKPGDILFAEIQQLPTWGQTGRQWVDTTFVVGIVDPAVAAREIATLKPTPG